MVCNVSIFIHIFSVMEEILVGVKRHTCSTFCQKDRVLVSVHSDFGDAPEVLGHWDACSRAERRTRGQSRGGRSWWETQAMMRKRRTRQSLSE